MCEKTKYKTSNPQIDKCIRPFIKWLQNKHVTVGSCCGHKKYPLTVVVREKENNKIIYREIVSQKIIPRTRRFYRKDDKGYYYIPEVSEPK